MGEGGLDLAAFLAEADNYNKDMPILVEHLKDEETFFRAITYLKALL
ncbi:MAG: hypothetical protein FWH01_12595 [Oscillospiraceae bacterium]|nr:hypothetical protein [Oscillospiraceae bacterium]